MAFFKKNENETAYVGGEKHFIDVIKNSGPSDMLVWRQPEEDFNTNSKVIVMPGETAVFVDGGNIVQTFEEGTYNLSTNNYPFISRLKNQLSGGISTFNCVVFFFRKADSKELKWGTDHPLQARDKVHGIRVDIKARGTYKVRIENPALFLEKCVGSNLRLTTQDDLDMYFKNEMLTKIKSNVQAFLNGYQDELIGIDAFLADISEAVRPQINTTVSEYGLYCVNFSIIGMDVDKTKYDNIDEAQVESIKRMKQGMGEAAYMNALGENWDKMKQAEILNNMASNSGAGGIGALGAGLGASVAMGGAFSQMAGNMFGQNGMMGTQAPQPVQQAPAAPAEDPLAVLTKLKQLLDAGLIEQSEYDSEKAEILSRM